MLTNELRRFHLSINISSALAKPDKNLDGVIESEGRALSGKEAKHLFWTMRQRNPKLEVFTGEQCDNQDETGKCLGHAVNDNEEGAASAKDNLL